MPADQFCLDGIQNLETTYDDRTLLGHPCSEQRCPEFLALAQTWGRQILLRSHIRLVARSLYRLEHCVGARGGDVPLGFTVRLHLSRHYAFSMHRDPIVFDLGSAHATDQHDVNRKERNERRVE